MFRQNPERIIARSSAKAKRFFKVSRRMIRELRTRSQDEQIGIPSSVVGDFDGT